MAVRAWWPTPTWKAPTPRCTPVSARTPKDCAGCSVSSPSPAAYPATSPPRPRGLGGDVAGYAAGEGELTEQPAQSFGVLADAGVHLGVGAFQVGIGHQARTAMAGSGHVDDAGVAIADDPVQVGVDEVEPGCGAPVPQQPGF